MMGERWGSGMRRVCLLMRSFGGVVRLVLVVLVAGMAIVAPWIGVHDLGLVDVFSARTPPAWHRDGGMEHLLGTDQLARTLVSRIVYGVRLAARRGVGGLVGRDVGWDARSARRVVRGVAGPGRVRLCESRLVGCLPRARPRRGDRPRTQPRQSFSFPGLRAVRASFGLRVGRCCASSAWRSSWWRMRLRCRLVG